MVRYGLVTVNILFFFSVASFVVLNRNSDTGTKSTSLLATPVSEEISNPLDELSSADIAVNVAQLIKLDETTAVINNADSQSDTFEIIPADAQVVAKPQIVSTDTKSAADVQTYVVVGGDSVSKIADKFNISADSVRWSNGITGNYVEVGDELSIPPVDGFIYTVKEGDTLASLASRFSSSKSKIASFNDIEISGLVKDSQIVIPGGRKPFVITAPRSFRAATYGYNGYDFGYCTYYVANKVSVPTNWGNAKWWDDGAARTPGWGVIYSPGVGEVPAGAILVSNSGYYGHVAYVEKVNPDGSLFISEMNAGWNWNVKSSRTVPVSQLSAYNFVIRY